MKDYFAHLIYKRMSTLNFIRRIEWRSMLEWLNPKRNERILDVACGGGILSLKIAERGCNVHGIDTSENAIKNAKNRAERENISCEFEVGNVECLPYQDKCFDKVVCSSSLEHFRDDVNALKEMHRVLKSNGHVVLTVDSFTYPINNKLKEIHRKSAHVVNYYTYETLKKRLKISGFEINKSKYLLSSPITSFFYTIGIKTKWSGGLWTAISFIAHPLCSISDKLFGLGDKGYTLIVEAKKTYQNSGRG